MPFYEFECNKGHVTEKLMSIAQGDAIELVVCEECDKTAPKGLPGYVETANLARRILSPTPTTFVSAGGRKL